MCDARTINRTKCYALTPQLTIYNNLFCIQSCPSQAAYTLINLGIKDATHVTRKESEK